MIQANWRRLNKLFIYHLILKITPAPCKPSSLFLNKNFYHTFKKGEGSPNYEVILTPLNPMEFVVLILLIYERSAAYAIAITKVIAPCSF